MKINIIKHDPEYHLTLSTLEMEDLLYICSHTDFSDFIYQGERCYRLIQELKKTLREGEKMSDKKYPYIGECVEDDGGVVKVLFVSEGYGAPLENNMWFNLKILEYVDKWKEKGFRNITRIYLENTKIEVGSPEHSEFVQKLVFNTGGGWKINKEKEIRYTESMFLFIDKDLVLTYEYDDRDYFNSEDEFRRIQLPFPQKQQSEKKSIKEECIKVGDEVVWGVGDITAEVLMIHDGNAFLKAESALRKSLTPEEKLADILTEITGYQDRQAVLKGARMIINGEAEGLIYKEEK